MIGHLVCLVLDRPDPLPTVLSRVSVLWLGILLEVVKDFRLQSWKQTMRALPAILLALGATSAPSDDLTFMQGYTRSWGLLAARQNGGGLARSIDPDGPVCWNVDTTS